MSVNLNMPPDQAWRTYIVPSLSNQKWIEDSKNISSEIGLSKRELLGLILYSYWLDEDAKINVCWDSNDYEPNDGYLQISEDEKVRCEHKVIPQMSKQDILDAIKSTHAKYAKRGVAYGSGRHFIIHCNQQSKGLVRISDLHNDIGKTCTFDKVFLASINGIENRKILRFSFTEQFPKLEIKHLCIDINLGKLIVTR